MQKLYLYLASRSKQGIKLISVLKGDSVVNSRVTDLNRLNLPQTWQAQISRIIDENKMLYEPWIESADSYNDLKVKLRTRGFTNVGSSPTPMIHVNETMPKANTSSCKVIQTMTRRKW